MTLEQASVELQGILDIKIGKKNAVTVGTSKNGLIVYELDGEYRFLKKHKGYNITYKKVGRV